jgi:adenylate cyclase class IV
MIEVELKCMLPEHILLALYEQMEQLMYVHTVHNIDQYYDTLDFTLLQQSVFVRVRNAHRLEFKINSSAADEHVQSLERTFPLVPNEQQTASMNALFRHYLPRWHDAPTIEAARTANGLIELATINNMRREYRDGEILLSLDAVEGLGNFLELEIQCPEGSDTSRSLAHLRAYAARLGLQEIPTGYVELWLHAHHLQAYRLAKCRV